jgi:ParB-like chromosome segregation protein Spo0J
MTLEVAYVATTDLIPYANNPRTHSDQQVAQVAASIQEFGFNNPILIDEHNSIIAGHGRLAAAQKLDMNTVPTILLEGLSEAQRKAYVIADNKLTENGGWDYDLLAVEIERLAELDIDLTLTGMDEIELAKMLDEPQEHIVQEVDYAESFSVVVECGDESEQEKIFNRLNSEGYKCRVQSL